VGQVLGIIVTVSQPANRYTLERLYHGNRTIKHHRCVSSWLGSRFFYIISGITSMALGGQAQATDLLLLLQSFSALVLGVTLYALTRGQGPFSHCLLSPVGLRKPFIYGESAIYFSVGSLFFSWLLLRGRLIPVIMAWLGVIASALLIVILPLQLVGLFGGTMSWASSVTWLIWLPMLIFEVALALWLIVKGIHLELLDKSVLEPA
jgi:hypothetical protein